MLGHLFQSDPDLRLTGSEIYLDPQESRKIGIISHGHSDHIGRHEHFVATAPTAAFLRIRSGDDLRGTELAYRTPHTIDGFRIELFPAGHVLGSAMVRIESEAGSLAYTGDFRLAPSYTAEPAEIPQADSVIMESTYGSPEWVFPPREEVKARLLETIKGILGRNRTPILLAYSLGKAQEVASMLRGEEISVVMHPTVARISSIYERHGIDLGDYEIWGLQSSLFGHRSTPHLRGKVVIIPPHMTSEIRRVRNRETVLLSGWTLQPYRSHGADHGIPLSDHADFLELLDFANRCQARVVYVTHGSRRFAEELRRRGIRAEFLRARPQMRLF